MSPAVRVRKVKPLHQHRGRSKLNRHRHLERVPVPMELVPTVSDNYLESRSALVLRRWGVLR